MKARIPTSGQGGRISIFGFLTAIAPLSIDIYLPALPMLRQTLAADEAHTLSAFLSRAPRFISIYLFAPATSAGNPTNRR
jgi:hypothetical protein